MNDRLKRLADELTVVRGALSNIGRSWSAEAMKVVEQAETILRAAASETVGTEWGECITGHRSHNPEIAAARVAVAEAKRDRDAALAKVVELEAKPPRQWTNNRPKSIASYEKWWQTWMNGDKREYKDRDHEILRVYWRDSDWARDSLWLPYVEGDTRDNLPPLPNSSATLTGSPTPATAEAKADDRIAALERLTQELASAHADDPAFRMAGEALKLVEKLASTMQLLADLTGHQAAYSYCNEIIADARKAGGA